MHTSKALTSRWLGVLLVVLLSSAMGQNGTDVPSVSLAPSTATQESPPPTTIETTMMPSQSPSQSPMTELPTDMPTPETEAPSESPPTVLPTAVTPEPSVQVMSEMPSDSPTSEPTETAATPAPSPPPVSSFPSTSPTFAPSEADTSPSALPTLEPTGQTTEAPSTVPPSEMPSHAPSELSSNSMLPSLTPTAEPTGETPTASPMPSAGATSLMPTADATSPGPTETPPPARTVELKGLKMRLNGLTKVFTGNDGALWSRGTETWVETYWRGSRRRLQLSPTSIPVETTVTVQGSELTGGAQLEVTYDQEVTYRSDGNVDEDKLFTGPFAESGSRELYVVELKDTARNASSSVFDTLTTTTPVVLPEESSGGDSGLSTGAIIGIACGGAAGLALLGGGAYYLSKRDSSGAGGGGGYLKSDHDDIPPSQLQLSGVGPDEVSTLEDPKTRTGMASGEELTGYGDQSVATVDYDYSKAYGGAGDTSVSSAGGTFGSNTQGQASAVAGLGAGAALAGASYSDDESFDAQYRSDKREEVIDVYAPAGKLGVVIDTPDDGPPVVHAIKSQSVIADKLQVGDMLIAVDDEDVRSMTAIKVSKLISRKSGNSTRKLTVVRTSAVE